MLLDALRSGMGIGNAIAYIFSALIVIFLTLPIHEWAHGFTAYKLGDPTPKYQGRLTLNPFAHIDYIGAAAILIFGFGWAKPVRVDSRYFKRPKLDMAITALAGPLSNIIVAFIALLFLNLIAAFFPVYNSAVWLVYSMLRFIVQINIGLAVFNLIPIPPLDGSRLLSAFLPDRLYYKLMRYENILFYVILALIVTGALNIPLSYLSSGLLYGMQMLVEAIFSLIF